MLRLSGKADKGAPSRDGEGDGSKSSPVTGHELEHHDEVLSINIRTMDDAVNTTISEPLDVVKLSLGE